MKPHEETWEAIGREVFAMDGSSRLEPWDSRHPEREPDIARLAAQAPAMARLLLSLVDDDDPGLRHVLGEDAIDRIKAVLRAAGVLPSE